MKIILYVILFGNLSIIASAQNSSDSMQQKEGRAAADDPSQFLTRVELFNELQHYKKNNRYLNQTILRTVVKIGKRFTTRVDIPFVYNSISTTSGYKQFGIGDISFRLLGYKFIENSKSAVTASIEISLNSATSPILGTGKNIVIPVISYSKLVPREKMILALILQQANSIGGDEERAKISFTKIQAIAIKIWSPKMWTVLAPEWYIDYMNGGVSMNLKGRFTTAPSRRINVWAAGGVGIFGDFIARFQWSGEIGSRYFLFRNKPG